MFLIVYDLLQKLNRVIDFLYEELFFILCSKYISNIFTLEDDFEKVKLQICQD
jgi:hypothetical protein